MFCSNCGRKAEDGAKFCAGCGAPIGSQTAGAGSGQTPPKPQQPAPDRSSRFAHLTKRKGCLIAIGVVAFLFLTLMVLAILNGGEISFSTANISEACMASRINPTTSEPLIKKDIFPKRSTTKIYAVALAKNIPGKTKFSAVWYHIPSGSSMKSENDLIIDKDMWLNFSLANPRGFVAGEYKVELLINDKVKKTLYFSVE